MDIRIKSWRENATFCRVLSGLLCSEETRLALLETANRWDRMASALEAAQDAEHLADALEHLGELVSAGGK